MPPIDLYDRTNGRPVRLTPLGAGGGESRACAVRGRDDVIALIPAGGGAYPPAVGDKVEALVDGNYSHPLIGFPVAVLVETHDPDTVVGFLAPKFNGPSLDDFLAALTPDDARRPVLALLLVKTFEAAEGLAIATGDNHPGNWLVECDARGWPLAVRRIDPLGLVLFRGRQHYCPMAHLDFVEPEVQGSDIGTVALGPKSDRFALAVLLFMIFTSSHPAMYGWAAEPDVGKRIARRLFACVSKLPPEAKVDRAVTRAFTALPPAVQSLLRRGLTRDRDERPSPAEWLKSLTPLMPAAPTAGAWQPDWTAAVAWLTRHWRPVAAGVLVASAAASAFPLGRPAPTVFHRQEHVPHGSNALVSFPAAGTAGDPAAHRLGHEPYRPNGLVTSPGDADEPVPPPNPDAWKFLFAPRKEGTP